MRKSVKYRKYLWDSKYPEVVIIACSAFIILLSLSYAFVSFPSWDDICRLSRGPENIIDEVVSQYWNWGGRWASAALFLYSLHNGSFSREGYVSLIFLNFAVWMAIFKFSVDIIFQNSISGIQKIYLYLAIFAVFISGVPSQPEAFYWYTDLIYYTIPTFISVVIIRVLTSGYNNYYITGIICSLFSFLASGFNELLGVSLFGVLFVLCGAMAYVGDRRRAINVGIVCLATLVGLTVVVLAPGNAIRQQSFSDHGKIFRTIALTFIRPGTAPLTLISDPRLLAFSVFLLASSWFRSMTPVWVTRSRAWLWLIPVTTLGLILGCSLIVGYSTGAPAAPRVQNIFALIFFLGWLALLVCVSHYWNTAERAANLPAFIRPAAAVIAVVSMLYSQNTLSAIADFPLAVTHWRSENNLRWAELNALRASGKEGGALVLAPLHHTPAPLIDPQIIDDPDHWVNHCVAQYAHVSSVRVPADSSVKR